MPCLCCTVTDEWDEAHTKKLYREPDFPDVWGRLISHYFLITKSEILHWNLEQFIANLFNFLSVNLYSLNYNSKYSGNQKCCTKIQNYQWLQRKISFVKQDFSKSEFKVALICNKHILSGQSTGTTVKIHVHIYMALFTGFVIWNYFFYSLSTPGTFSENNIDEKNWKLFLSKAVYNNCFLQKSLWSMYYCVKTIFCFVNISSA